MAWVKEGTTTLSVAGDSISVSSLTDNDSYIILTNYFDSGNMSPRVRLNSDTGSNYSARYSEDGATDTTLTSQGRMSFHTDTIAKNGFSVGYIFNVSTEEKLFIGFTVRQNTAGAGNAPKRAEAVGKHAQTSNPVDEIEIFNPEVGGDFASDSTVSILGAKDTALTSVNIQDGTIFEETDTNKSYIWNASTSTWTQL